MLESIYKLRIFGKKTKFPSNNLEIWVPANIYDECKQQLGAGNEPIFGFLRTNSLLDSQSYFGSLQALTSSAFADSSEIWLSEDVVDVDLTLYDGMEVRIEPIDVKKINEAVSVKIELNETQVQLWSEAEVEAAKRNLTDKGIVTCIRYPIWVKPLTKKQVLAKVVHVKPEDKAGKHTPYKITPNTTIVFDGLPNNQQQVIDYSQIGGLDEVIAKLREIIQIPLQYPNLLEKFGVEPPKGLLLYGPPGNGKTTIARAIANNMGANFFHVDGPELLSGLYGQGEYKLREMFEEAAGHESAIIFFDEIDSLALNREKYDSEAHATMVGQFLACMDGLKSTGNIFVIGATNRLHTIDPAFRRPGRFELEFEIPIPNQEARYDIITKYVDVSNEMNVESDVDDSFLQELSELTNGYSGADIKSLYRESVMNAIRKIVKIDELGKLHLKNNENSGKLSINDFLSAIKTITPTSLRGVDVPTISTEWEDIIGLQEQQHKLLKIHGFFTQDTESYKHRPDFLNLIFCGRLGSGRKTVVKAFSKKFNYELLYLNLMDMASVDEADSFSAVDELFAKAKQVSPSIIYIINLQHISKTELYVQKILNNIRQLGVRHKIMVVVELDALEAIPKNLMGYKAFGENVSFDWKLDPNTLAPSFSESENQIIANILERDESMTIGQLLSEIQIHAFASEKQQKGGEK